MNSPYNEHKILMHPKHLEMLGEGILTSPITLEVDPADGFCNFKCGHCCFQSHKKKAPIFIDRKKLFFVLGEAKIMGSKAVEFVGGGEPTTHPEIALLIKDAHSLGYEVGVVTNGFLLEKLFLVANLCTYIRISLDAGNPETFRKVHGVNGFSTVLKNITGLTAYMSKKNIGISYLITELNADIDEMERAVRIVKDLDLGYIVFKPASVKKSLPGEFWLKALGNIKLLKKAYSTTPVYGYDDFPSRWDYLSTKRDYGNFCWAKPLNCVIMADGNIPLCFLHRRDKKKIIGNIYKDSFRNIWSGERHRVLWKKQSVYNCPYPCKFDGPNRLISMMRNGGACFSNKIKVPHPNFF